MSKRNRWLAAVNNSDLPADAKRVAEALADFANDDGTITDPDLLALLQELDRDRQAGQS